MENPTISILLLVYLVYVVDGLTKVIVPAVYKEWLGKGPPNW